MTDPTFAKLMRLIYIDMKLECGPLNRQDITDAFGMSVPQASNDISTFQALHPETISYDHREKFYYRPVRCDPAYPSHLRQQVQLTVLAIKTYRDRIEPDTHRQRGGYVGGV